MTETRERIYIDCEFNGFGGELISLAMVTEHGPEFYAVLPPLPAYEPWVRENVLPVLRKEPVQSFGDFRLAFLKFLRNWREPVIIADWPADLFYFYQVLLGDSYKNSVLLPHTAKLMSVDYVSALPHNALEDARAIASEMRSAP